MAPVDRTKSKAAKKEKAVSEPKQAQSSFDLAEISSIVELIRTNGISEFRLERGPDRLWLRREMELRRPARTETSRAPGIAAKLLSEADTQESMPESQGALELDEQPKRADAISLTTQAQPALLEIKSPMVGTFYRRPAVDADPYVQVGDIVKKGTVLCIVEAMKLMNEIESTAAGQIAEVCLEDGQMVEYGEVLFRIRPSA